MKRNFNVVVKDHEGHPHVRRVFKYDDKGMPVLEKVNGEERHTFDHFEPMTLRSYALDALAGRWRGEEGMSNEDLWKRMKLHDKLAFGDEVDIKAEEGQMILDAMNKQGLSALVIGRMKDLLDTDPPKE